MGRHANCPVSRSCESIKEQAKLLLTDGGEECSECNNIVPRGMPCPKGKHQIEEELAVASA